MRFANLVPGCVVLAALVAPSASASREAAAPAPRAPQPPTELRLKVRAPHTSRLTNADVDARVLASLIAESQRGDFNVAMRAAEIGCSGGTCHVALTVRLPDETAPSRLAFAVAGPTGELSQVRHAECLTSLCSVTLIVERGRNTIAVGVTNEMTQTAGFATAGVVAAPDVAMSGKPAKAEWF
jgi:hypothetical protein